MTTITLHSGRGPTLTADDVRALPMATFAPAAGQAMSYFMANAILSIDDKVRERVHLSWSASDPGAGPEADREFLARCLEQGAEPFTLP